ncbi:MAG: hypothetical protein HQK87_05030 [Nitrospinae bacterium]|nr:hypothetical protein [Nitrospinota bacterium]
MIRSLVTLVLLMIGAVLFRLLFMTPRRGDAEREEPASLPLVGANETFVEVFSSTDTTLLDLLAADLAAAGIPNMVVGRQASALGHLPSVAGSIQTPERFAEEARALIATIEE